MTDTDLIEVAGILTGVALRRLPHRHWYFDREEVNARITLYLLEARITHDPARQELRTYLFYQGWYRYITDYRRVCGREQWDYRGDRTQIAMQTVFHAGGAEGLNHERHERHDFHVPVPSEEQPEYELPYGEVIKEACEKLLTPRERLIIAGTHWMGLTLEEVGTVLGLGRARICQLRSGAYTKLRTHLEDYRP